MDTARTQSPVVGAKTTVVAASVSGAASRERHWVHIFGLLFVVGACALGAVPLSNWSAFWQSWGFTGSQESWKWATVALVATTGVSFLKARPIFVVIYAFMFGVATVALDALIAGKLVRAVDRMLGAGMSPLALVIASAVFGYLVYTNSRAAAPRGRTLIGFGFVAFASLGAALGWIDWKTPAERIGPAAVKIASEWGNEVTWATVLIFTAVGVSFSRARPVHLLNAVLLTALAYACVRGGYSRNHTFPELSTGTKLIQIEYESYSNVDTWRWVVAVELCCIAAILLHASLGMGALNVAFALTWMIVGMAAYKSIGTMSVARAFGSGTALAMEGPLENMGLPVGAAQGEAGLAARGDSMAGGLKQMSALRSTTHGEQEALKLQGQIVIRELTTLAWVTLTALLAGVIGVTGFRMMAESMAVRVSVAALLWLGLFIGAFALIWVWPKDPAQSWEQWLAAFKFSRYHLYLIWLIFVASMAIVGIWSLLTAKQVAMCSHAAAAAVFLGTAVSLVAAAVLITFGGFPKLPVWVYCVLAAGQSSLAWALLFHLNPPMRKAAVGVRR